MICTVFADLSYGHIKLIPSIERGIVNKIPGTLERSGFQGFFCRGSILALPHQNFELFAVSELAEGQKCPYIRKVVCTSSWPKRSSEIVFYASLQASRSR